MKRFQLGRWLLTVFMVTMGILHFAAPAPFVRIVPDWLPAPLLLVYISGAAEFAGGVGLAIPELRRAAAIGLILLYLAVFPANVHMALHQIQPEGHTMPVWMMWARLPFQLALIYWASRYAKSPRTAR